MASKRKKPKRIEAWAVLWSDGSRSYFHEERDAKSRVLAWAGEENARVVRLIEAPKKRGRK
jgi:hypothetical protein